MNDLELVTALLTQLGIVYRLDELTDKREVVIESGTGPANTGYSIFYTSFEFTPLGKFTKVGAWE